MDAKLLEMVAFYEQGHDLAKEGKIDEAAEAYKQAYELTDEEDRKKLICRKVASMYYMSGHLELSRP